VFRWPRLNSLLFATPRKIAERLADTLSLHAVWALDDDHVWVMDEQGASYASDFANQRWTLHRDPSVHAQRQELSAVGLWGTGPQDVWAIHEEREFSSGAHRIVFRHFDVTLHSYRLNPPYPPFYFILILLIYLL
jgi:hypothetical protein